MALSTAQRAAHDPAALLCAAAVTRGTIAATDRELKRFSGVWPSPCRPCLLPSGSSRVSALRPMGGP